MECITSKTDDWVRDQFEVQEGDMVVGGRGVRDDKCDVSILATRFVWLKESGCMDDMD